MYVQMEQKKKRWKGKRWREVKLHSRSVTVVSEFCAYYQTCKKSHTCGYYPQENVKPYQNNFSLNSPMLNYQVYLKYQFYAIPSGASERTF